jgi:hypothetical protein
MKKSFIIAAVACILVLSLGVRPAAAQVASSFEQLQVLVEANDKVLVRDFSGNQTRGRISVVSPSLLRLVVDGTPREFSPADVLEIRQRRGDSLGNGAIIGLIAGAAFGSVGALIICAEEADCAGAATAAVLAYGAIGAGMGVGVDALIRRERTIYRAPARPAASIRISPIVTKNRQGIAVSWKF